MGIFFFGQTKLEFFSFSGGVSNLMLANFLKILTEKIPVFSIPPRMPIYLKIYAAYFLKHYLHLFFNSMKGPQWIKIMRIIKTKNQIRGNPGLCLANQILTKQRPGPLKLNDICLGYSHKEGCCTASSSKSNARDNVMFLLLCWSIK